MIEKIRGAIDSISKYFKSVNSERKRITWPTPQELKASTIIVLITLIVITTFLGISDFILTRIFDKLNKLAQ